MCIMEIHPGQHACTMVQALLHNSSTVVNDMNMLIPLMDARGELSLVEKVEEVRNDLEEVCEKLLQIYADELVHEVTTQGIVDIPNHSNERGGQPYTNEAGETYEQITAKLHDFAVQDAARAARYESRR